MFFVLMVAGCTTPTKRWQHVQKTVVWTAMVSAAQSPDYFSPDPRKRWIVTENNVDVNAKQGRIIIRRKLARSLKLPLQKEQIDRRDWIFVIELLPDVIPTATFKVPESQFVPARSADEANRYFSQVDMLLHPTY
tara:strand:+ start:262 stop:666 length:405 start_codon:yes stop_codon:yes gene_type:complete